MFIPRQNRNISTKWVKYAEPPGGQSSTEPPNFFYRLWRVSISSTTYPKKKKFMRLALEWRNLLKGELREKKSFSGIIFRIFYEFF